MSYKEAGLKGKEWGTMGVDHSGEGQMLGKAGGSKTWHEATEEEKEQRKVAGREGGKNVFDNLSITRQEEIMQVGKDNAHLGAVGGEMTWETATPKEQARRKKAGTEAFSNMSGEKQQDLKNIGAGAFGNMSDQRQDDLR